MNYCDELERRAEENLNSGVKEKLLLHVCCAPCASYCLEALHGKFDITCYFYNPNITDEAEYAKRLSELERYVRERGYTDVKIVDAGYGAEEFYALAKGREDEPERGTRCFDCYALRLKKTAFFAKEAGFSCFATTLTVSPHKRADVINEKGAQAAKECGVTYLKSDFKKRGGYMRSIELSKEYGLYRQNYCGCEFSRRAAEREGRI